MKRLLKRIDCLLNGSEATQTGDRLYRFLTKNLAGILISLLIFILIGIAQLSGGMMGSNNLKGHHSQSGYQIGSLQSHQDVRQR